MARILRIRKKGQKKKKNPSRLGEGLIRDDLLDVYFPNACCRHLFLLRIVSFRWQPPSKRIVILRRGEERIGQFCGSEKKDKKKIPLSVGED